MWKRSELLGSKEGSCFADGLLRASHLGMYVCYSLHGGSAQAQTSSSVLWHSQGGGPVSPITCSPFVILPSFPLFTSGTAEALCTLCRGGRNSSCMVPSARGWEDSSAGDGHPMGLVTWNS